MKELVMGLLIAVMVDINFVWLYVVVGLWVSSKIPQTKFAQRCLGVSILLAAIMLTYIALTHRDYDDSYFKLAV